MSDFKDFYQKLVSIPNLVVKYRKEDEVRNALKDIMNFLELVKTKVGGVDESIVKQGRQKYSTMIKDRCDHLYARAEEIYNKSLKEHVDADEVFVPGSSEKINDLRDFYHYLYYTVFYAARYTLVFAGEFDISQHREIIKALKSFCADDTSPDKLVEVGDLVITHIKQLESKRNNADYIFNEHIISKLSNTVDLKEDFENVGKIFTRCEF
jgi:uncharacterized protein (UPF0332 family)